MAKEKLTQEIREAIDQIRLIDAHEHIRRREDIVREGANLYTISKYGVFFPDLITSGMPPHLYDKSSSPSKTKDIWKILGPYIENIYNTGYYRTLMVAFRDLYGFKDNEITEKNWEILNKNILESYQREDWYDFVLKNKLNIEVAFLDAFWDPGYIEVDKKYFLPAPGMDPFVFVRSGKHFAANAPSSFSPKDWWPSNPLDDIMNKWKLAFETLNDYINIIDFAFRKIKEYGGYAIKLRIAYNRDLTIDNVQKSEAEKIFNKKEDDITAQDAKKIEDFIVRIIIEKSTEYNFPVQLHTGMHGIPGNPPQRGNPYQLINLLNEYPKTKFILFHGSYPFIAEMTSLVKSYPNAYLDICWLPWLLYENLKKYLSEWLSVLPCNKIMISGDAECVERCYSALFFAKKCFAEVLSDHVERGYYSKNTAIKIANKLFRENPQTVYNMK